MGRIPYWGFKSNLCGADLEGGGASNLTGADRGRMWIGAVSPASWPGHGPWPLDFVCQILRTSNLSLFDFVHTKMCELN